MIQSFASLTRGSAAITLITLALLVLAPAVFAQNPDRVGLPPDSLGTVVVNVAVDTALVVIDDDFSTYFTITPDDSVLTVPVGNRKLSVATRLYRDYILYTDVQPDTTRVINLHLRFPLMTPEARILYSSWPRLTWESNLAIHTDPGSEIYIDGQHVGGHRAYLDLSPGTYRVRLEDPAGRKRRADVIVGDNRLTVAELYLLPEKSTFFAAAVIPGAGQFYRGDWIVGAIAFTAVTGFATAAFLSDLDLRNRNDELEVLRRAYRNATDERLAWELGNELERIYHGLGGHRRTRNILIGTAAGLYVAQLVDALRPPREGFRRPIGTRYLVSPTVTPDGPGIRLRLEAD